MARRKTSNSPPDTRPRPVQKRFIVRSAEEAVSQVREVLGPDARVISVRQVKGDGLQRFLASPRLEIIAQASDSPPVKQPVRDESPKQEAPPVKQEQETTPVSDVDPVESSGDGQRPDSGKASAGTSSPEEKESKAFSGSDIEKRLKAPTFKDMKCGEYLGRAGFSDLVMSRLASQDEWRSICDLPIQEGLTRAVSHLREDRQRRSRPKPDQRVAFVGGAGSGKTTALCKLLARDTFLRNLSPQVLRVETDKPHMDDGLPLYCEVLGLRCCRSHEDLDLDSSAPIYIDVPGYSIDDRGELERVRRALDQVDASSRILVMNGAYEASVLHRFLETGDYLGAQFQVISHVDELVSFGKLWENLFDTRRHLMFFSTGQNVASDMIEDTFGFLLERTFPR